MARAGWTDYRGRGQRGAMELDSTAENEQSRVVLGVATLYIVSVRNGAAFDLTLCLHTRNAVTVFRPLPSYVFASVRTRTAQQEKCGKAAKVTQEKLRLKKVYLTARASTTSIAVHFWHRPQPPWRHPHAVLRCARSRVFCDCIR